MNHAVSHLGAPAAAVVIAAAVSAVAVLGARSAAPECLRASWPEPATAAVVAQPPSLRETSGKDAVERRITAWRVRLRIAPEQAPLWDAVAGALRDQAALSDGPDAFAPGIEPAPPHAHGRANLPQHVRAAYAVREAGEKQAAAAWAALYDRLSDEQKDIAASLPIRHDGLAR